MSAPTFVRMKGDVVVSVPPELGCMTSYVLLEQEDWFEDEIRFVRRLLVPGMRVVDVGANYGMYTLAAARAVGAEGRVWAFEPVASTHARLAESVRENRFDHVEVVRAALSDRPGTGRITTQANAELNALVEGSGGDMATEETPLETLDGRLDEPGFRDVAFVKIDAEGHESHVIKGGTRFFTETSPLVMFEIKAGKTLNLELVQTFGALGYHSYALVPGLEKLMPIARLDVYRLNLFCCKPDRAAELEARGLLVSTDVVPAATTVPPDAWSVYLDRFPYGRALRDTFREYDATASTPGWEAHREALCLYAYAQDEARPAAERLGALRRAIESLWKLVTEAPNASRLQSCIRIATDLGERRLATELLDAVTRSLREDDFTFSPEPFLCACPAYATIDPGEEVAQWAVASLFAAQESLQAYSSFFTGQRTLEVLETIRDLGFQTPEMERRRQLVRLRFGLQPGSEPPLATLPRSADHLNTEFWSAGTLTARALHEKR